MGSWGVCPLISPHWLKILSWNIKFAVLLGFNPRALVQTSTDVEESPQIEKQKRYRYLRQELVRPQELSTLAAGKLKGTLEG